MNFYSKIQRYINIITVRITAQNEGRANIWYFINSLFKNIYRETEMLSSILN